MNILDEIFAHKREEVIQRKKERTPAEMEQAASLAVPALGFVTALTSRPTAWPALIAEIKKASPSRGLLINDFDPVRLAQIYLENGASAISILTDERYFQGNLAYLSQVAQIPGRPPLLRKDFICDPYQVFEARAAGADAILLIAASLDPVLLRELHQLANSLGMAALVEVHNRTELDAALSCSPSLVGVNNRDLRDFSVRIETSLELQQHVPPGICLVAESGIHSPQDVQILADGGFDAVLVGESLVTSPNIAEQVRRLAAPAFERNQTHEN